MKLQGKLADISIDFETRKPKLTFLINNNITSLEEIEKNCPKINGILEGKIKLGVGSTIIDCTSEKIKVLREGPIKLEEIKKQLDLD